ncbi:MAG: hypothetical protein R3C53_07880 [Pirellulaceae bacterium]
MAALLMSLVTMFTYGQQVGIRRDKPHVTLGQPRPVLSQSDANESIDLWGDPTAQGRAPASSDLRVQDVSERTPVAELALPRSLHELPPVPAPIETDELVTTPSAEPDELLLAPNSLDAEPPGSLLNDERDLLLSPSVPQTLDKPPQSRASKPASLGPPPPTSPATSSALDALPLELLKPKSAPDKDAIQETQGRNASEEAAERQRPVSRTVTPNESSVRQSFDPLSALPESLIAPHRADDDLPSPSGLIAPPTQLPSERPSSEPSREGLGTAEPVAAPQATDNASKKPTGPQFFTVPSSDPITGQGTRRIPFQSQDFCPSVPFGASLLDPLSEELIYRGKFAVPTQRPLIEWGKPLYTGGIYLPGNDLLGSTNLIRPHFFVYGDWRTGLGVNRNAGGDANSLATRLNLDMDFELTATERIHAFMGPLDRGGDFTRLDFSNSAEFVDRTDIRLDTLFFEGDAGAIWGGLNNVDAPFDLPFSFGFLPLIYQNGIWANDNVIGAAVALPARHSRALNWSNYDATFFWASDQVTTDAFAGDNNAAEFFGTAWFIDAYDGYIEADYAFVHDDVGGHRSYHNLAVAFTRRYMARISNSVRYIVNFGQSLPDEQKTADGHLLLLENSLISAAPNTFVPYCNLFYGQGRPQSLARAGIAGGVLNNVGINFETDGLTGYPTLDATGHNAYGAAIGMNILGSNFSHQLVLEAAALGATGSQQFRNAPGDQYALGMRYQKPLSNAWIFRTDHMVGFLRDAQDIHGSRIEFRWKF